MPIKQLCVEIIRQEKEGITASFVKPFLLFLSYPFRAISGLRSYFYDKGYFKSVDAGIFVISVGNIVAGGSGKTPYVISLAQKLKKQHKVAVLLRGFGGLNEKTKTPLLVLETTSSLKAGDEAVLIKRHLKDCLVIACKDRVKGAQFAKSQGATLVILDDGFQHRRLFRNEDVVIIDGSNPFGFNHFLPRGFLRESPKALNRADKVIVNGEFSKDLSNQISQFTQAPITYIYNEVSGLYNLEDQKVHWPDKGEKVAIFCAIGNPQRFFTTVANLGFNVVASYNEIDHKQPEEEKLIEFALKAKEMGAKFIVCTEKDRVKIKDKINLTLPILWIGITCKGD
jgi:tetraacyldisaccharide 4'-kinase